MDVVLVSDEILCRCLLCLIVFLMDFVTLSMTILQGDSMLHYPAKDDVSFLPALRSGLDLSCCLYIVHRWKSCVWTC